jgi:3'-5' exonuclease
MLKSVKEHVWAFDCEWAPDPQAGRLLYDLPAATPDRRSVEVMWLKGGATPEDPAPFLKMILCRVVSIAAVCRRRVSDNEVKLNLLWLPRDPADAGQQAEKNVIGTFLQAIGRHKPQLVGFNSKGADLKILVQRAVAAGLSAPDFCRRPDKPWEGADYFARDNESHIDLMEILSGWGEKRGVSLNELAVVSGIPGKFGAAGEQVAGMWLEGKLAEIVQYNCFDALTTYLVWLRLAHFAGHFSAPQYEDEQQRVRELLMDLAEKPETAFLEAYFDEWERLQQATEQG